jgi:lipid-binding SYLF domain-containing protein
VASLAQRIYECCQSQTCTESTLDYPSSNGVSDKRTCKNEKGENRMKKFLPFLLTFCLVSLSLPLQADDSKVEERLKNCGLVIQEIMDIPDDIPQDLIDKADCVIVYPSVLKGAFIFGGSYGRGAMTCRSGENFNGPWSAPTMMALEGGSFGFQIGGQATDFVLLVMNQRGATAILKSKVKLGGDASAAAGPKGRNAEASTDVTLRAEILSYSRARGLFAGISLTGSTVRPDNRANEQLYHKSVSSQDIVFKGAVPVPPSAQKLISYLNTKSPKNKSSGKEF